MFVHCVVVSWPNNLTCAWQLAGVMLSMFDPTVESDKELLSDVKLVPLYRNAKVVGAVLPGA